MPEDLSPDAFELLARLADRYYVDGQTQVEIAREFALSRPKVQRLLEQARLTHVVEIRIEAPPWLNLDLEAQLREAFRLSDAIVSPDGPAVTAGSGGEERSAIPRAPPR